jgi:hypothetical protein
MSQSGPGVIRVFEDFVGAEVPVALTTTTEKIGSFRVIGDGIADADSGVVNLESDGLSGVAQLTTTNEDKHGIYIATPVMFDVGLMGTIVLEARIRLPALANREVFIGFSDVNSDDLSLEDDLVHGASTTITLTASDLVGFLLSSELTDTADWHTVYNGGTTSGATASGDLDVGDAAVAGEWQVFRLEIFTNGTVRWYIDGKSVGGSATVRRSGIANAVSTSVDLAMVVGVEAKTTTALTLDIDYIMIKANRDWTV